MATQTKTKSATRTTATRRGTTAPRPGRAASSTDGKRNGKGSWLVIVESPAKARTIQSILGDEYTVIPSVGHVRDLPERGYGVEDIKGGNFTPKYVVVKGKESVIRDIAEAARRAERVFLSTDPDREGEAISWHIKEAAEIPDAKAVRVVFHSITKPAIEEAFREALQPSSAAVHGEHGDGRLDMHLVDAQQTRRVLDRLIGYPLTWFVQKKVSKGASAGRVQSVALRLIVEREREIQGFKPQEYWTIHALLARDTVAPSAAFTADLARLPGQRGKPNIPNGAEAEALMAAFKRSAFAVSGVKKGERKNSPAPPFTTSTFQQAANNRLGMGASRAMGVAQALYEGIDLPGQGPTGLITYMRTDSLNVDPGARREARSFVGRKWGGEYVPEKERVYRARTKGAQEAHEAIRPTDPARTPESLRGVITQEQMRVYELIWRRFMASQMADARYERVDVEIEAKENGTLRGTFRAGAQNLVFAGHLAAYGVDANDPVQRPADDADEDPTADSLPALNEGDALERRNVEGKQHFTEPPPRYTEASLVKALEEKGIGRPSTYATIVQTVQKREYVKREGRALVPQELGFIVNDLLVKHVGKYVAPDFTSEMEEELDEIAEGGRGYEATVRDFWKQFDPDITRANEGAGKVDEPTDILCDVCGQANFVKSWVRGGRQVFRCPRFPECRNIRDIGPDGRPVHREGPKAIDYTCPKCGGELVQKAGPFGEYVDCVNRDSGKCDFRAGVPVGVACPEEPETGQLVEKQARGRKQGVFYGCWNYPNCSYTTNSLEPGKMSPIRTPEARAEANKKLLERSARGKAAFAKRKANATTRKAG